MAANDQVVSCTKELTIEDLFLSAIGIDATGNPALRLYEVEDVGNFMECAKAYSREDILKRLFTLDDNGRIAIRIARTP